MSNINGVQRDAIIDAALATLDQHALSADALKLVREIIIETLDTPANGIADGYAPGAVTEVFRRMLEAASRELFLQTGLRPDLPADFGNLPNADDSIQ